jgi:hypothetical protein
VLGGAGGVCWTGVKRTIDRNTGNGDGDGDSARDDGESEEGAGERTESRIVRLAQARTHKFELFGE